MTKKTAEGDSKIQDLKRKTCKPDADRKDHKAQLIAFRESIDNIDASLVFMLAERFKITKQVGYYKKEHDLPPADPSRENEQIARLRRLSREARLDPEFSEKFLHFIINEVIRHHERIRDGDIV